MSIETPPTITKEVLDKLQTLIQANLDSFDGFKHAANKLEDPDHWTNMFELAFQRGLHAERLRKIVALCGEKPVESGSMMASAHRCWTDLKTAVTGGDAHAILAEAERGEDYIKGLYEDILKETAGEPTTKLLNEQYARVKEGHDLVRAMRDAAKS